MEKIIIGESSVIQYEINKELKEGWSVKSVNVAAGERGNTIIAVVLQQ